MFKLFYYPLNASMAPHFILEALQLEFELILVDRKSKQQKSEQYLQLNPSGRIPTFVDDELILSESAAICLYLADLKADANLIPALGSPARAKCYQWLMYLTNTLQAEIMLFSYPEKYTHTATASQNLVIKAEQNINAMLTLIDKELADKDYLLGENLSVCDFYLFMLAVWADELEKPPLAFFNLTSYLKILAQHPAIIKVCDKEGLSLTDYQLPHSIEY